MCSNHRLACNCGQNQANILLKNHILTPAVVSKLYCPECSQNLDLVGECMIADNDWVLEFDLVLARSLLEHANVSTAELSPAFLFDHGYATWNGFTPNELEQRLLERQEIIPLANQDMRQYLNEIKRWGCERVEKFRQAGWRKAQCC